MVYMCLVSFMCFVAVGGVAYTLVTSECNVAIHRQVVLCLFFQKCVELLLWARDCWVLETDKARGLAE